MGQLFTQTLPAAMPSFMSRLDLLFFKEDAVFFVYAPALDVTGYGMTENEAQNSFVETLEEFLSFTQKNKMLESELKRLGWKQDQTTKVFQPPFLDEMLQNHAYLSEIVREYDFQKSNFQFAIA
jgi:O-methyltransferase involved in polyketide biosynthesis